MALKLTAITASSNVLGISHDFAENLMHLRTCDSFVWIR